MVDDKKRRKITNFTGVTSQPLPIYYAEGFTAIALTLYSANASIVCVTSNMKLVHWPLIGGLLHVVQREGDWAGSQLAQASPRCTKCNKLTHQRPVYQSPCCCTMVCCSACGFNVPMKRLNIFPHSNLASKKHQLDSYRPSTVIQCIHSSICIMDLPAPRTIPFLHGNGLAACRRVYVRTGMNSSARTSCEPTAIVAGLRPACNVDAVSAWDSHQDGQRCGHCQNITSNAAGYNNVLLKIISI